MPLPIVHYNDPILRKKGAKVTAFTPEIAGLANGMVGAMNEAGGIGLAAQQVGLALQLCIVDLTGAKRDFTWEIDGKKPPLELWMPMALVNPIVTVLPGPEDVYE